MRVRTKTWGFLFAALSLGMLAGCAVNSTFAYKPNAPVAGAQMLPVKVAVLPFKDGTEDFTDRGSVFSSGQYNLAKAGVAATITALTPEMWAKSFAEDLRTSGGFREARFVYTPSELSDEDLIIEGTVRKALAGKTFDDLNEFALSLRASTKSDKRLVWERDFSKAWNTPKNLSSGCGMGIQCALDKFHGEYNTAMREIFAAARVDLMATLASRSGGRPGEGGLAAASPGVARNEEFVGVGLEVGVSNNVLTVVRAMQGAPASKGGMQSGDAILSIDGKPTAGMTVVDAVGMIRGVKGTSVSLRVTRAGWDTPRDITLVRDVIRVGNSAPPAQESVEQTIDRILGGK